MFPQTQQLFQRLSRQFPDAREWFDAIRQWYKDAKLSAGVIEQLLRGENLELLSLNLNGEDTSADVTRETDGHRILLRIPSARLRVGENTLTLGLTDDAEQPLELEAVQLGQPKTQFRQKIDLDTLTPAPAPAFQLTGRDRAEPRAGCWELRSNGHLAFRFYLHTLSRVVVALEMPRDARFPQSRARLDKQKKLLKEVGKRVEEKLKKWIDEAAKRNDPQAHDMADDLRAYAELYAKQIRPAIEGEGSLQTTINRTGNPDGIVTANAQPVVLAPAVVTLVAEPFAPVYQATRAQALAPVYQATRVRPPAPARTPRPFKARPVDPPAPPRRSPATVANSGGFLGKLFVTLLLAGLSAGAYAAWKNEGLGWLNRQITTANGNAGPRGNVLTALRESGTDLGWKPEVCQELPADKMKEFADTFGEMAGPQDAWVTDKAKVYIAGERKNAMAEAIFGIPMCEDMLVVHDFGDANAAKQHMDTLPANYQAGLQRAGMGVQGETAQVVVPNCDGAVRLTTRSGQITQQQVIARSGRFVLQTHCTDMSRSAEQERRLAILAKRLNEHFPR